MNYTGVKTEAQCFDNLYNVARQPNFKNIQIILFIPIKYIIKINKHIQKKKLYLNELIIFC